MSNCLLFCGSLERDNAMTLCPAKTFNDTEMNTSGDILCLSLTPGEENVQWDCITFLRKLRLFFIGRPKCTFLATQIVWHPDFMKP